MFLIQVAFTSCQQDPTGAPLAMDKEMTTPVSKLPIYNNQLHAHLASLRPIKKIKKPDHMPFSPLENKPEVKQDEFFSPKKKMIKKPDHMPFSPLENKPVVKQDEFLSPNKGDCLSPLQSNQPFGIRV